MQNLWTKSTVYLYLFAAYSCFLFCFFLFAIWALCIRTLNIYIFSVYLLVKCFSRRRRLFSVLENLLGNFSKSERRDALLRYILYINALNKRNKRGRKGRVYCTPANTHTAIQRFDTFWGEEMHKTLYEVFLSYFVISLCFFRHNVGQHHVHNITQDMKISTHQQKCEFPKKMGKVWLLKNARAHDGERQTLWAKR